MSARRIALLGAESTGKTQLSHDLAALLRERGSRVAVVGEVLREWCDRAGRTPRADEQQAIAEEQERRVDAALAGHDFVIADTTALMVATYSALLFVDRSLHPFALARLRSYDALLLTGLDLPWVADGHQRDGPHAREPVDQLVRAALQGAALPFQVVYGSGPERARNALTTLQRLALVGGEPARPMPASATRPWSCEKCSDPDCEHRLFTGLLRRPGS